MKVLKFGGTSVGTSENIKKVISIAIEASIQQPVVVVVSAMGGITNKLLKTATQAANQLLEYEETLAEIVGIHKDTIENLFTEELKSTQVKNYTQVIRSLDEDLEKIKWLVKGVFLTGELTPKMQDKLLSFGEKLSSTIIYFYVKSKLEEAVWVDAGDLIKTDKTYTKANVNFKVTDALVQAHFKSTSARITILAGFVAKAATGEQTTLGRGGSDYTAAIVAAALNAEILEIWTDVSGMFTANPSIVKQAMPIPSLSYEEALELSHFGAKVIYPPTIIPVLQKKIPIAIKNTLDPDAEGTKIEYQVKSNDRLIKGISNIDHIALITLQGSGMVGVPGYSKRLFETLANEQINIVFITQSSSEHSVCIGVVENDAEQAKEVIDKAFELEIQLNKIDPVLIDKGLSILAIVGENLKNHQGVSGQMFSVLGKNNVSVRAIAQGSSERNISAVVSKEDVNKAINSLHEQFFENKSKQINLFIAGVGNVGQKLLDQINLQKQYLKDNHKIKLRVIGISNSRKMLVDEKGIHLNQWQKELENGEPADLQKFLAQCKKINVRNSVFVDITANETVAKMYPSYLKDSISVVACNKIACSASFEYYHQLKYLARKYNASFLFETNVGAGLPIIDTLNNLIKSGDKIISIKAVLSGSLNFIFNNYNGNLTFKDIVQLAKEEGYTEPDPRIDLSGVDVARKILILARESGYKIELEEININNFLSEKASIANTVEEFMQALEEEEIHYQQLLKSATKNNSKLKYVAELIDGKAKVGIQEIPAGHPFYNLEGKDNIVMFYTQRYSEQPMIIKGAGAGAAVTASGLFADIIRISNT